MILFLGPEALWGLSAAQRRDYYLAYIRANGSWEPDADGDDALLSDLELVRQQANVWDQDQTYNQHVLAVYLECRQRMSEEGGWQ